MESSVTFEVQTSNNGSWAVHEVCTDKNKAIDLAKHIGVEGGYKAVKVVSVTYDQETSTYIDKETFYAGKKFSSFGGSKGVNEMRPVCQTVDDLFRLESCRIIGQLLAQPLQSWKIRPLELLHSEEYLRKVCDTGTILQAAAQRVAVQQIKDTKQEVNERVREIYDLVTALRKLIREQYSGKDIPLIENKDMNAVVRLLTGNPNISRILAVSLCRYLSRFKSQQQRFDALIELVDNNPLPQALRVLDAFIADYLSLPEILLSIFGTSDNLGDTLLDRIAMIRGDIKVKFIDRENKAEILSGLMKNNKLPRSEKAIINNIKETVASSASFDANSVENNLLFHRRIHNALIDIKTRSGEIDFILENILDRCSRTIGNHTIVKLLNPKDPPWNRALKLFEVSKMVVGTINQRTVANYILPILQSPPNKIEFLKIEAPFQQRMLILKNLYDHAISTELPQMQRNKIIEIIDEIGMEILQTSKFIERVRKNATDAISVLQPLLVVLCKDILYAGPVRKVFLEEVKRVVTSNVFKATLDRLGSSEAGRETLKNLQILLKRAGYK